MCDTRVDSGAGGNVSRLARLLLLVGAEQPGVMALLDDDEGNTRFVIGFELNTSFTDSCQLVLKYCAELSLADAVAVHDNAVRLEARRLVEQNQQFPAENHKEWR